MLRSFRKKDVELESLQVKNVAHNFFVCSCRGSRYEIDEGLMVDMDVERDTIVNIGGEVHDEVV